MNIGNWIRKAISLDANKTLNQVIYQNNIDKAIRTVGETVLVDSDGESIQSLGKSDSSSISSNSILVSSDIGSYVFDASGGTITLSGIRDIKLEEILNIINVTDGIIIYDINDQDKLGSISSNVITLNYDTSSMDDSDSLQIWINYNNSEDYNQGVTKVSVENTEWDHYTSIEHIVDESNLSADTYFISIDVEAYRNLTLQFDITDATGSEFKIYSTLDESATVPSTGGTPGTTWHEQTSDFLGGAQSDDGTDGYLRNDMTIDTSIMPDRYLLEYTVANATNSIDVWIRKY